MSSTFTALFKASEDFAVSSYVVIDDVFILLDCGLSSSVSLDAYLPFIPQIRYILISNPTMDFVGALPYIVKHPDFKAQIYITNPVQKMSRLGIYDHYFSTTHKDFNLDDINAAYDKCISLKHSQKVHIKEKGLVFTPYRAGNNVGGSVWRITHNMQDIVYMPTFNPHPVKHLKGLDFSSIQNPAALILDGITPPDPEKNTEQLCERIKNCLTSGGSVLMPVDASGSVLELLFVLEKFWELNESEIGSYPLIFLSHLSSYTVDFAKSYVEWMNEESVSINETGRENPFLFKFVKVMSKIEEIQTVPACILASPGNMEYGFSRELFFFLCSNPVNQVIILNRSGNFVNEIIDNKPQYLEVNDEVLVWREEETSTDISESVDLIEEVKAHEPHINLLEDKMFKSFGPRLFEEKPFKSFAVCEWKHFCDEYGENMAEEEMELWQEETLENDLKKVTIESFSQTLNSKLFEVDRIRKHSVMETVSRKSFLNAEICYFLCCFRANTISVKLSLAKIQPRKVILIQKLPDRLSGLIEYCRNTLGIEDIQEAEGTVQLISSMSIHPIKLSEEFYNTMKFLPIDGYEVAYISGQVKLEQEQLHFEHIENQEKHFGYFLGGVKLGHIRNLLIEKGFRAEFRDGKLVINDRVVLFKQGSSGGVQDYVIEGVVSKEYFDIRNIIYSQHIYV